MFYISANELKAMNKPNKSIETRELYIRLTNLGKSMTHNEDCAWPRQPFVEKGKHTLVPHWLRIKVFGQYRQGTFSWFHQPFISCSKHHLIKKDDGSLSFPSFPLINSSQPRFSFKLMCLPKRVWRRRIQAEEKNLIKTKQLCWRL